MSCSKCNRPTCDGNCGSSCDPCNKGCSPAKYGCDFDITANPFDASVWNVTICGATTRVKIPKIAETDTKLSVSCATQSMTYQSEKHTDVITGEQLGCLLTLDDISDVDATLPDSCDLLVWNPSCSSDCGEDCVKKDAAWTKYHIPDATGTISGDSNNNYKVLTKNDCGCIEESYLHIIPTGMAQISYIRDSVPEDPDAPYYYGIYNDTIGLHLKENAPNLFGKYALKVTVNYGIQVFHPTAAPDTNFRSLVCPAVEGEEANVAYFSSLLQGQSATNFSDKPYMPWGTVSMRGSLVYIVPKGKEMYLHHEFRLRGATTGSAYLTNDLDGQKVPDELTTHPDRMAYTASRLNALQIIVEPSEGTSTTTPTVDTERGQLDDPVDLYPNIV